MADVLVRVEHCGGMVWVYEYTLEDETDVAA